jgi:hypothetical protein
MAGLLEDVDFLKDEGLEILSLERIQGDHLDGHSLFWITSCLRVLVLMPL